MHSSFRSAITVCLVPEASQGPFVYHAGLVKSCDEAKANGFDAIELFPPDAQAVDKTHLKELLDQHGLALAAVGSGAGWVRSKLTLTSKDESIRTKAIRFVQELIDLAGGFGAPVIIGSMQGRVEEGVERQQTLAWLAESLRELANYASEKYGTTILYEPLNRYETNIFNRMVDTGKWLEEIGCNHVKVLVDLFHANIEEASIAKSIRQLGAGVGHVHFADSNRMAVGFGHTEIPPVVAALSEIGYQGYLSAEVFPLPNANAAAAKTIEMIRYYCG